MIARLTGKVAEAVLEKDVLRAIIDVQGVGYEVLLPLAYDGRLRDNSMVTVYVSESVTAYDGATTLYGFLTKEDKELFLRIRDNVGGFGPKKALECVDKISKSLPDFKRAVMENDQKLLVSVFGFTKKTAEKLAFSLKAKIGEWKVAGPSKWESVPAGGVEYDALSGLVNLGYSDQDARLAIQEAKKKCGDSVLTEQLLTESLRLLAGRHS